MRLLAVARGVVRILLALVMAVLGFPLAVLVLILSFGVPQTTAYLGQRGLFLWSWLTRRLLGIRVRVEGTPPPPGSFAVCNHVSHFDILVLTGYFPTSLIAKKEILRWPLLGQLAWMIGTVFVDRSDRDKTAGVAAQMGNYLRSGVTVTLFPEGTCGDGQQILPFKRSLFSVPADLKIPTYPVALRYPNAQVAWNDSTPMPLHMFRLLCQPRQEAILAFGQPIPPDLPRKELAFATQAKVEDLFAKLDG